ncbi:MAG: bifunctional nuclease family protein [Deltaproteobacteria bacterium]|nr:bifunctional nuclease family protein [Deltaproteobacteria bacterium]
MTHPLEEILMKVKGLVLDPDSKMPIVVLQDQNGENLLPIWIGVFEANAIAMSLESVDTPRPMTHDLLFSLISELGGEVSRIVITDLRDSTFYALIYVEQEDRSSLEIDARPSDALALALRAEVPFYVTQQVLDKASVDDRLSKLTEEERLKKWLEEVKPEDLGKYTM